MTHAQTCLISILYVPPMYVHVTRLLSSEVEELGAAKKWKGSRVLIGYLHAVNFTVQLSAICLFHAFWLGVINIVELKMFFSKDHDPVEDTCVSQK